MKFITDFVTNSSSNSYCVSLSVEPTDGKEIKLDLYPNDWDFDNADFRLKSDIKEIIVKIKQCATVRELIDVLIDESVHGSANDIADNFEEIASEIYEKISHFRKEMGSFHEMKDIKSIIIREEFSGWGEFAYDTLENYMIRATPPNTDWESLTEDELRGLFGDDIFEDDLDNLIAALHGELDGINPNGDIFTTVFLTDGRIQKTFDITL